MKVARTVWTYTKTRRLVRDGKPVVTDATVGGNKVAIKNNAVEVKYAEETDAIPALTVNFKEEVKVQSIIDETGKEYNTAAQLEEAKAWLGYTGDLTAFTKSVTLTGTTKTFADVIAKLGDSFKITVVNEAGETLTLTINLKLDVPAPVSATVSELKGTVLQPVPGVFALKITKAEVVAKFGVNTDAKLLLTIGDKTWEMEFKTDKDGNEFWAPLSIQKVTEAQINAGVVTVIK